MAYCDKCGKLIINKYTFCFDCSNSRKTYVNENGYRVFSDSGILLYRWVAENKQGRELLPGEIVHHKVEKPAKLTT